MKQTYTVTFETGHPYRVHHSYIWLAPFSATIAVFAVVLVKNIRELVALYQWVQSSGGPSAFMVVLAAVALLAVIYAVVVGIHALAYRNLSYVFDERELSVYSGIITKRHVHVPYQRVQSVNHRAGVLQRIFGLCTVSIDTAGGASNKAVRIPYVQLAVGERIRIELFVRKAAALEGSESALVYDSSADAAASEALARARQATVAARGNAPVHPEQLAAVRGVEAAAPNVLDDAADGVIDWRGAYGGQMAGMEPVSFETGLANKELLLTSISHDMTGSMVVVLTLVGIVGGIAGQLGAWFVILMMAIGWASGLLSVSLQFGGFAVRRRGSRIEVEKGLLQREFSGIDIDRVQSLVVRQTFIRRCMGYCEVSLGRIDAGSDQSGENGGKLDRQGLIIHPFLKLDRVDDLLAGLLPEFADRPTRDDLSTLPQAALRRAIVRRCIWRNGMLWTAGGVTAFQAGMHLLGATMPVDSESAQGFVQFLDVVDLSTALVWVLAVVFAAAAAVSAVLWFRTSGFACARHCVALFNDGLWTDFTVIPRTKLQTAYTRDNPFQRRAHVTSITAVTAAGVGHTATRLWDVSAEEGRAYVEWFVPRTAQSDVIE